MDPKKKVLGFGVISLALCFYIPLVQLLGPIALSFKQWKVFSWK